jgi:thiosulfate dehydrogenase (quinone) large subunit
MGNREYFEDPPVVKELFQSTRFAWIWLLLRLWLGYKWLDAAAHKLGNPDWVQTGAAVRAFWERAVQVRPRPPSSGGV